MQENVQRRDMHRKPMSKGASVLWTTAILVLGALLVVAYFHYDRQDAISRAIRSTGGWGIAISILLMGAFCVIPVPSEFLMIMNMKVFGVWWGIFYTWVGAMLGGLAVFFLARYVGRHLLRAFVSDDRLHQVNEWMGRRGATGLLLARLVPLPFIVVNYAAGVLRSVKVWDYIWTTGIGLLPYDLGAALVFLGFSTKYSVWLVVGGVGVIGIWLAGYLFNRFVNKANRWAH